VKKNKGNCVKSSEGMKPMQSPNDRHALAGGKGKCKMKGKK
jgi:hypothetical protein